MAGIPGPGSQLPVASASYCDTLNPLTPCERPVGIGSMSFGHDLAQDSFTQMPVVPEAKVR